MTSTASEPRRPSRGAPLSAWRARLTSWRRPLALSALLFVAGFALYALVGSGERPFADATPIWEVAESIVRRGSVAIRTSWPPELPRGADGKVYAAAPLLASLVHVPGAEARRLLGAVAPATAPHTVGMFSHLAPAALGALVALLFFWLLRAPVAGGGRPLASPVAAAVTTAGLLVGTMVFVYARLPYAEILHAACFLAFVLALLRARARPDRTAGLLLGAAAGALVAGKVIFVVALPGAAVWLLWPHRRQLRALGPLAAWTALGALPFLLLVLGYNHARWGGLFATGYTVTAKPGVAALPPFGERLLVGLWGLFLSPGKSLFLYSPPLLAGLWALPRLYRRAPEPVIALLVTAGPVVLVYARFLFWAGDWAWGPRYLVFLVPPLMLPVALLVDAAIALGRGWRRRLAAAGLAALLLAGVAVQALGAALIWDRFIRISHEATGAWLGRPDRAGAAVPVRDGLCGACLEDMYPLQWLPPFQPIAGHAWLVPHVLRGDDWRTAERDAPWHRYTTLTLDISSSYANARLDWWFLELYPVAPKVALALLLTLLLAMAAALLAFVRILEVSPRERFDGPRSDGS
jgi:hypothetical protein